MAYREVLSALADENRRSVLLALRGGRLSAAELAEKVGMSPQALSYHLSKLKRAGLIYETRVKNFIYYELDLTVIDEAVLWLNRLKGGTPYDKEDPPAD